MASANLSLPNGFGNIVKLFPLPSLVLFPGLVQALHIFEPRYRQMMADALDSDHLISMALLRPPTGLDIIEPLFPTICIGKIATHVELEDGRYNLILAGICRAKIVEELMFKKPYRLAKVELPVETEVASPKLANSLRQEIVRLFRQQLSSLPQQAEQVGGQWLDSNLPLGQLCDLVTFASKASPLEQIKVLELFDVRARAELVIQMLSEQLKTSARTSQFPPDFSLN